MTLSELRKLKQEEIVEVNGIQLGFQVSTLSCGKYEKKQEEYLLESYYQFLEQSKQNGFMTQYIQMTVNRAICIFDNVDNVGTSCFRKVSSAK